MTTTQMLLEALKTMGIGVTGVFAVLAVFYVSIRLMMNAANKKKD